MSSHYVDLSGMVHPAQCRAYCTPRFKRNTLLLVFVLLNTTPPAVAVALVETVPWVVHLVPQDLTQFVVQPSTAFVLQFSVSTHGQASTAAEHRVLSQLSFNVSDYRGTVVTVLTATVNQSVATLTVGTGLPHGYYEFTCLTTSQVFGTIATPTAGTWGPLDDRFAVVAGFTQICNTVPTTKRAPLLGVLRKLGVGHYRDFPQMPLLRPNASAYTWDTEDVAGLTGKMDSLHNASRDAGLKVMDCFIGTEPWNTRHGWYDGSGGNWMWPRDLGAESDGYAAVAARWGDTEAGLEADNEADAKPYTPDQYSVVLKIMRYGIWAATVAAAAPSTSSTSTSPELVCGVFTDAVHSAYLQGLARNQLASVCDAISYHSYTDPANVQVQ